MTDGIVNVLKPPGMTSHDVVSRIRRIYGVKKAGHSGTLDPDAAGVLPVFIGNATRLLEYASTNTKHYRAEGILGIRTDTGDDSGNVLETKPVPDFSAARLEEILQQFRGKILQVPPMYCIFVWTSHVPKAPMSALYWKTLQLLQEPVPV